MLTRPEICSKYTIALLPYNNSQNAAQKISLISKILDIQKNSITNQLCQ